MECNVAEYAMHGCGQVEAIKIFEHECCSNQWFFIVMQFWRRRAMNTSLPLLNIFLLHHLRNTIGMDNILGHFGFSESKKTISIMRRNSDGILCTYFMLL